MTRQSRRGGGIPVKNLSHGASETPKMKAQEYPALILALIVAIGTGNYFFSVENTMEIQWALALLYMMWLVLKQPRIRADQRPRFEALVTR